MIAIHARLRERLAAEGVVPSAHREAIDEIADHLLDLHRVAITAGRSIEEADAVVEAELTRMGPLAVAVVDRDKRRRQTAAARTESRATGLGADLRHAVRAIQLERGFSAIVILTLAVSIGACTTVFSFINALLLGSLPYPDPASLVMLWETEGGNRDNRFIVARPVYDDWTRETRTLSALGIFEYRTFNVASDQEPEQVRGVRASASLFAVLGVPPAMGRTYTQEEDERQERVAVISDAIWRSHLGANPSALGAELRLNGEPFRIVGVMPPGFQFPQQGNGVWVPMAYTDQAQDRERDSHSFQVAARIKAGVTFENARADVEQIGRALAQRYPENADEGSTITRMADQGMAQVRTMLTALMGAVVMVLIIACVNVANLQLGRALKRRREFVLRLSLGAGIWRIARQLFTESLVLAVAGGAGALLLTWMALGAADSVMTSAFRTRPFRGEVAIAIDGMVLLFTAAVAVSTAVLFGFAPLLGLRDRSPNTLLREGDRGAVGAGNLARRALVGLEVALAIVVLCGAGLLIKSLAGVMNINPGLDPRDVLTLQVSLPQSDTYGPPVRESFCVDLSRAADGLPGVRAIGAISHLPLSGANAGRALTIEGRVAATPDDTPSAAYRLTCPGYFAALGIRLLEGRDFADRDTTRGDPVVIVNRATAARYWPGESALGRRLKIGPLEGSNPWMTVVGVADDIRHFGLDSEPRREIYLPYAQRAWPAMTIAARTVGDPLSWQATLKDVVKRVDPGLPIAGVRSMEDVIESSVYWREMPMKLLTGFALIGLLLASIGVYGVLAYFVSQRTRELGVRAALGATRHQLSALVIRQSILPLAGGVVAGVAGSVASGRFLQELLYEVQPGDLHVITAIVLLLVTVGLLASWLPARRAASINPMTALRDE
jgi:predicted permease